MWVNEKKKIFKPPNISISLKTSYISKALIQGLWEMHSMVTQLCVTWLFSHYLIGPLSANCSVWDQFFKASYDLLKDAFGLYFHATNL